MTQKEREKRGDREDERFSSPVILRRLIYLRRQRLRLSGDKVLERR